MYERMLNCLISLNLGFFLGKKEMIIYTSYVYFED